MVNIQSIKQISFVCVCVRVGCEGVYICVVCKIFFFFSKVRGVRRHQECVVYVIIM
jgi:hypothetical protein